MFISYLLLLVLTPSNNFWVVPFPARYISYFSCRFFRATLPHPLRKYRSHWLLSEMLFFFYKIGITWDSSKCRSHHVFLISGTYHAYFNRLVFSFPFYFFLSFPSRPNASDAQVAEVPWVLHGYYLLIRAVDPFHFRSFPSLHLWIQFLLVFIAVH